MHELPARVYKIPALFNCGMEEIRAAHLGLSISAPPVRRGNKRSTNRSKLNHLQKRRPDMATSTNTVRLYRVLRTRPERVYKAFLDPEAMAKWLPPYGYTCKVHEMDAKVGGTFRMSFTNFGTGNGHSFGGKYLELVPGARIRYTDKFDDPNLPGEMVTTVTLKAVSCGTELNVVQEGIPAAIPAEMCYLGWQESLMQLATLVEPDIPG